MQEAPPRAVELIFSGPGAGPKYMTSLVALPSRVIPWQRAADSEVDTRARTAVDST